MTARWWVTAALVLGALAGSAVDVYPQGRPGPRGGPKGGGKGQYGGSGGYGSGGGYGGPKGGYSVQDQLAARQESASRLQLAQLQARQQAAQLRGAVLKTVSKSGGTVDDASAIAALVAASGGKFPATGAQLRQSLDKLGEFVQLPIPFSAVSLESGLANPRVVLTARVGALDLAEANRPNLDGRLFLAANMEKPGAGAPRVESIEFISWNARRRQFDFGVVEDVGGEPRIQFLDGVRCFSCHKNRGPILGAAPWSNTAHNDVVRRTAELAFLPPAGAAPPAEKFDGMMPLVAQAPEVDAGVRLGASLVPNRETFRLLNREPDGRRAFVILLVGVTATGNIEKIDREIGVEVNKVLGKQFVKFAADWMTLQKAAKPSLLIDFSPAGSAGTAGGAWGGNTDAVARYDVSRILGNHGLPSRAQPSNPGAFRKPPVKAPTQATHVVSAALLARTIGLSEGDRKFFARTLEDSAKRINQPRVGAETLARQVFEGSRFEDVLGGGELPDREDFKDRFAAGLDDVLRKEYGVAGGFAVRRADYASGPAFAPVAGQAEPKLVPTTACLRCHEVRGEGRARFVEPLPALAFDPFDRQGRESWLRTANPKRQQDVLARMLKRLTVDRDMPPEDEPEYEHFRVNDAAAFDEAGVFLEAALKKAKGK